MKKLRKIFEGLGDPRTSSLMRRDFLQMSTVALFTRGASHFSWSDGMPPVERHC